LALGVAFTDGFLGGPFFNEAFFAGVFIFFPWDVFTFFLLPLIGLLRRLMWRTSSQKWCKR
jgi:hypothetical protein